MLIYVLDDEPIERNCWQFQEDAECNIQTFGEFTDFQAAMQTITPDAVVIDLVMPLHPGTEVCEWLLNNFPDVPRFVCSGLDHPKYEIFAKYGCKATFIPKSTAFPDRLEVIRGCKS